MPAATEPEAATTKRAPTMRSLKIADAVFKALSKVKKDHALTNEQLFEAVETAKGEMASTSDA